MAFNFLLKEIKMYNLKICNDVKCLQLSNDDYDNFLSENIAVIYLYDSSVNNSIIECIARGTPILTNPHPAVIEYLGENYPLYYNNVKECQDKMYNMDLLYQAHLYLLQDNIRQKVHIDFFLSSFEKIVGGV